MKKVFNHRTNSKNLILAAAAFFAAAMVVFPSVTESGSKSAIIIWANAIVPVLLPFFIFADSGTMSFISTAKRWETAFSIPW